MGKFLLAILHIYLLLFFFFLFHLTICKAITRRKMVMNVGEINSIWGNFLMKKKSHLSGCEMKSFFMRKFHRITDTRGQS